MFPPMINPMLIQQLRANPAQILQRAGYNVPQGMNDPHKIVDHLVKNGQLTQQQVTQMQQRLPGYKF